MPEMLHMREICRLKYRGFAGLRGLAWLALAVLAGGCSPLPVPPQAAPGLGFAPAAAEWPVGFPLAEWRGGDVWRIDPAASLAQVTVRRGGVLAALGHDHVVASRQLRGFVSPQRGVADLALRVDALTVDETALRAAAGLDSVPGPDAIAGTRRNMLEKVLFAQDYPWITAHIERAGEQWLLTLRIRGQAHGYALPLEIEESGGRLKARARLVIRQSDFGMTPFAVMGGALRVEDAMELKVEMVAWR